MSNWKIVKKNPSGTDPLAAYHGQPMIANPGPKSTYLGRIIVEFYEDGSTKPDANKIAFSVDAVDGNHDSFAMRVAKALVARLEKQNPLNQQS